MRKIPVSLYCLRLSPRNKSIARLCLTPAGALRGTPPPVTPGDSKSRIARAVWKRVAWEVTPDPRYHNLDAFRHGDLTAEELRAVLRVSDAISAQIPLRECKGTWHEQRVQMAAKAGRQNGN